MQTAQIGDLLVDRLMGEMGGDLAHWRVIIGEVPALPLGNDARCNWQVVPNGTSDQIHAVMRAVDLIRFEHPFVDR